MEHLIKEKRKTLRKTLKAVMGKGIKNKETGIIATLSAAGINKMGSGKAIEKSKANGFSPDEHFEAAGNIKTLYENATLVAVHKDVKLPDNPNIVSIKRFVAQSSLKGARKFDALITVKESVQAGHRIYSIELDQINKVSSRWQVAESNETTTNDGSPTTGNPLWL